MRAVFISEAKSPSRHAVSVSALLVYIAHMRLQSQHFTHTRIQNAKKNRVIRSGRPFVWPSPSLVVLRKVAQIAELLGNLFLEDAHIIRALHNSLDRLLSQTVGLLDLLLVAIERIF